MANFTNNTTQLQSLLEKVNALPDAGSGGSVETCTVTFNLEQLIEAFKPSGDYYYTDETMSIATGSWTNGVNFTATVSKGTLFVLFDLVGNGYQLSDSNADLIHSSMTYDEHIVSVFAIHGDSIITVVG